MIYKIGRMGETVLLNSGLDESFFGMSDGLESNMSAC